MPRRREHRPFAQHQASTIYLRVPTRHWNIVTTGQATEFRAAIGNAPQLWRVPLPALCVCFRKRSATKHYDYRVMVLEGVRREALGAITDEGLAAAGYRGKNARGLFRREWMMAEKRKYEPLRTVVVFTVHAVGPHDLDRIGAALLEHLYGEFLNGATEGTRAVA